MHPFLVADVLIRVSAPYYQLESEVANDQKAICNLASRHQCVLCNLLTLNAQLAIVHQVGTIVPIHKSELQLHRIEVSMQLLGIVKPTR